MLKYCPTELWIPSHLMNPNTFNYVHHVVWEKLGRKGQSTKSRIKCWREEWSRRAYR